MLDTTTRTSLAELWRSALPTVREIRSARRRLHLKAVFIAALVGVSYWGLVIANSPLLIRLGCAGVLVTGLIAVATGIMHDANHGAFSRWPWLNRLVSYTADALGASSWLWKFKHNVLHHGGTNVEGIDSDIDQGPVARLAPGQPWRSWHRYQHIYLWPLYGFMALRNLIIGDLRNLLTSRIGPQTLRRRPSAATVIRIVAGKAAHFGWAVVLPLLFNPWWAVIVFYVCISWLVGFALAVTFQLAHCVGDVEFADETSSHRGYDFIPHQLRTTSNVASTIPVLGHLFRWIVGGLDHQIEHHLAPRLPHTAYARVAARFQRGCRDLGITYHVHPGAWAAVRSHARWLKHMGRPATVIAR